jgi:hypothetical protein|tara:strand:- start:9553 stop:9732 length:180 start_codon:yes stop_codon:yes gene_type:complete
MLLTMDAALEGAFDGALDDARGGEGDDSIASSWRLRLLLECEVCLEAWLCDDFALDLLE